MDSKKRAKEARDAMTGGIRTYVESSTGKTYSSWGPDTSERARNLRKNMFK